MIVTKQMRVIKPGDLFVVTGEMVRATPENEHFNVQGQSLDILFGNRLKLVCRHECGALEFLVLPPEQSK